MFLDVLDQALSRTLSSPAHVKLSHCVVSYRIVFVSYTALHVHDSQAADAVIDGTWCP